MHCRGVTEVTPLAAGAEDMAIWDAFAKAANQPLAVCLGGSVGPVRAYDTHGL